MTKKLNLLIAASEVWPFAKEGGLADVVCALAREFEKSGHYVRVVMPKYGLIDKEGFNLKKLDVILKVHMGVLGIIECALYEWRIPNTNIPIYFIDRKDMYDLDGGIYADKNGEPYLNNDNRFVLLSRAALELCKMLEFKPDIVHAHDWQTAAIPVFLNTIYKEDTMFRDCASVLTIHNLQYQGEFYAGLMDVLGIGRVHFNAEELEYYGKVNLLKGGINHADFITTVSENYASEIQTEEFGFGLNGVLTKRKDSLIGVLNGVDYELWNPQTDTYIVQNYSKDELTAKGVCKAALQKHFNLPQKSHVPFLGLITKLVKQKGIDVFAETVCQLLEHDIQLAILGSGETWANFFFGDLNRRFPGKVGCYIGYDETLAHQITAGVDLLLMPSRFEPCGLNQMYCMCYGTLPIVRAVGGLNDTVINFDEHTMEGTGFKFYELTAEALLNTINWAMHIYYNRNEMFKKIMLKAMDMRFTWENSAKRYEEIYFQAIKKKRD
ncbi:MAG: glycogen synthase GlgA [Candidatus Magnetoovum sp. WYHC-5]|nr:glycogen synthase GlgA [Candidatus Magnetoovum sp. WYHC-5]